MQQAGDLYIMSYEAADVIDVFTTDDKFIEEVVYSICHRVKKIPCLKFAVQSHQYIFQGAVTSSEPEK